MWGVDMGRGLGHMRRKPAVHGDAALKAKVEVSFRQGVLDPEAQAIERALGGMGFAGVEKVRRTKVIELELAAGDRPSAEAQLKAMCERLLANPVIETYRISLGE